MKCGEAATVQYTWGTKEICQCMEHANQVAVLAKHMGWAFCAHVYDGPELCNSEVEEEARIKPKGGTKGE